VVTIKPVIQRAWTFINGNNWHDKAFNLEKAYVSSLFCKLAYLHVPSHELATHDGIKLVPCFAYQAIARSMVPMDVRLLLQQADFQESFVIDTFPGVIIVGVKTPKVIMVAIRGTRTIALSDWKVDLNALHHETNCNGSPIKLHAGFYGAISAAVLSLESKLRGFGDDIPIYVTGHSLGGAMAAMAHGLWNAACGWGSGGIVSHSCYTFGMPRFGDQLAIGTLRLPHHIENDRDDIPTAPPAALGYAGVPAACVLHGQTFPYLALRKRRKIPAVTLLLSLPLGPIVNHYMELYIDQVAQKVLILSSFQDETNYGMLHIVSNEWRNAWQGHDR
jgi:Lipase (class 3)